MSKAELFAVIAAMVVALAGGAAARPLPPPVPPAGEAIIPADAGYYSFGTCCPPGEYSHYRRHHGFSLRLGWGHPSYGYPWADPAPVYVYPARPLVVAPAPAVPLVIAPAPAPATPLVTAPVVTGPAPAPWSAAWYAYCDQKYPTFDVRTGLYTADAGDVRMCQ
jgi:hypothetical protein